MLWDVWWVWMAAAIALAILEIFVPGFIFLGFALGAAAVAILMAMGLSVTLPWLLVIFGLVSVGAWVAMRQAFGIRKGQVKVWETDINED